MTKVLLIVRFICIIAITDAYLDEKEDRLPTKCHVCKHMTRELAEELGRSDKSNDVLYMGQVFQKEPKKIPYRQSELRLTEALENACSNVLDYKVHKEKPLALRYEKVESATFKTLKGLKKRGVKVDLGFPDQMWDSPDAEVTRLKSRCEQMVEMYEDEISNWYWQLTDTNLTQWLCVERVLKPSEDDCINETAAESDKTNENEENKAATKRTKNDKKTEKEAKRGNKNKKKIRTKQRNEATVNPKDKDRQDDRHDEEKDLEKIQRLIREQAEEQSRSRLSSDRYRESADRRGSSGMSESKRNALRARLRTIKDPDRLRREIRKIRVKELTEEEYYPKDPWENRLDSDIPEDVRQDMRRRMNSRFEEVEDFQNEIERRAVGLGNNDDVLESFAIREMLRRYVEDTKQIRDKKELRKRLEDLDALSAILGERVLHDEL